ncbi:MAG: DUF350 domain-containing protein [Saprospiraceae bacterium]
MEIFTNEEWGWLPAAIVYLSNALLIFLIGRWTFQRAYAKIDPAAELVEQDNFAYAIVNVGYYVGLIIAIAGVLMGESQGIAADLTAQTVYGILAVVLLFLSAKINDKLILNRFSVHKELFQDRNAGTGVIEAANFIAAGLIIRGAVSGNIGNFFPEFAYGQLLTGMLSVIIFWLVGQVLLIITSKIYARLLNYDIHQEIEADNAAAGIAFAGVLVALAVIIGYGVSGDFYSWSDHFMKISVEVLVGIIFLPILRWLTDWILLPGQKITDEIAHQEHPNIGVGLIEAFAYIGGAFLLTICL